MLQDWARGREMLKMKKWLKPLVVVCLLFPIMAIAGTGIDWLSSQTNPDGSNSLPSDIATSYQSTTEVLRTYHESDSLPPAGLSEALNLINTETFHSTEYLARKIIINADVGNDVTGLATELMTHQNQDGGFGEIPGYASTVVDTAFALEALAKSGNTSSAVADYAVGYLFNKQSSDGSWKGQGHESALYTTAIAIQALTPYKPINFSTSSVIYAAVSYMLSERNQASLWDESFISAHAFLALLPNIDNSSQIQASVDSFVASQDIDGSWGGDLYVTALALRAINLIRKAAADPTLGALQGVVFDAQTAMPLAGVNVTLTGPVSLSGVTDTYGGFGFEQIQAGNYTLEFSLSDYTNVTATASVSQGETVSLGSVSLLKGAASTTGTIQGIFTHSETSFALPGVTISVQETGQSAITSSDGRYQVPSVATGDVTLQAVKDGYSTANAVTTVTAGGLAIFSSSLTPVATPVTAITGVIKDFATQLPIPGATISLSGATTASKVTDENGVYRIEILNPGVILIEISATGYDSVVSNTTVYENNIISFSPNMYSAGTTPADSNSAGITGVVVDASNNLPLAGAEVIATFGSSTQTVFSDSSGGFSISGLTELSGELHVSMTDFSPFSLNLSLDPLAVLDIDQIRLRQTNISVLQPDLEVMCVDDSDTTTSSHALELNGDVTVEIENSGTASVVTGFELLAFYDVNNDNLYQSDIDIQLGQVFSEPEIHLGTSSSIKIPVDGNLPFRDAPIKVWLDSGQNVVELNEENNQASSAIGCLVQPDIANFEPVLKWEWNSSDVKPEYNQVMMAPVVAQTNDDNGDSLINEEDYPEIIFIAYKGTGSDPFEGVLRIISGKDGSELVTVTDANYYLSSYAQIAVGDIDGDGIVEIVAPRSIYSDGGLVAFEHDGSVKWTTPGTYFRNGWSLGGPSIADIDQDGVPEIIYEKTVVNNDGTVRWTGAGPYIGANRQNVPTSFSTVANIDLQGTSELVAGASAYDSDGNLLWQNTDAGDGFTAIANFNNTPTPEIVLVSRNRVFLLDYQGNIIWGPVSLPGIYNGGSPVVADVDGDGTPEIGVATGDEYTMFTANGSVLWQQNTANVRWGMAGSSAFDFDGDGNVEIVYGDGVTLRVFEGSSGTVLFETENSSGTAQELAVIADVDNDNHADIIVPSNQFNGSGTNGIRVFQDINNSWVNTRSLWNQYSYHITNINDDGSIPQYEEPSWLSHNSYRLNDFSSCNSLNSADLTVSSLHFVQHSFGLKVRVGNAGVAASPDQIEVAFYEGHPNQGGILIGSTNIEAIASGEFIDVQVENVVINGNTRLYAVVDSSIIISECNESNNVISVPGPELYPDLIPTSVVSNGVITDPKTFNVSGELSITVDNKGTAPVSSGVKVLAFYDVNMDEAYESGVDVSLGHSVIDSVINISVNQVVSISVTGELPFRDAPISVWVDSENTVSESSETNNLILTSVLCQGAEPEIGQIDPVQKWHWNEEKVMTIPLVGSLIDTNADGLINNDDDSIVVFGSHTGHVDGSPARLRAVNGKTGAEIWSVTETFLLTDAAGHPAMGDIDGDGIPEIVMYLWSGGIAVINNDGTLKWSNETPPRQGYYNYGGIGLADIDNDGSVEILVRNYVLNSDGSVRWVAAIPASHSMITYAADLDLDGNQEVIMGSWVFRADGSDYWDNSTKSNTFSAIANFDNDDFPEMVSMWDSRISLLDHDGSELWSSIVPGAGGGAPTIADMDGDGMPEIGVAGRSNYVVYNHDGSILWTSRTQDFSSRITGSTVFDFDGDGNAEIVYADEVALRIYDGATGSIIYEVLNGSATASEYPVVADIDGDNHAEILVVGDLYSSTWGVRAIEDANDSWVSTRRIWNQYQYNVDNVNDDGSIPANPANSWLTHNSFRLNAFPDRGALDQADLTIGKLQIAENGFGNPLSISIRVGNAGALATPDLVNIAFYDGDRLNGGIPLGNLSTSAIGAGEYRDLQLDSVISISGSQEIYAVVDPDDAYPECNEINNQTSVLPGLSATGNITVATNAADYGPDSIVFLNGGITNTSTLNGNYLAYLQLEDASGAIVATLPQHPVNGIAGGGSATIGDAWNTGNILAGSYVLRGILSLADGAVLDVATTTFTVSHGDPSSPAASLRTNTDLPLYHTTATVQLQNLVQNLTTNTLIDNASLRVVVTGPNGLQVFTADKNLGQLGIAAQRNVSTPYAFEAATVGPYSVSAELWDSVNNQLLASDTTQYQIENDLSVALSGQVSALLSELNAGDMQTCSSVVTNVSDLPLTGLSLRGVLVNMDQQLEITAQPFSADIALGESFSNDHVIATQQLMSGQHACILQAQIDDAWQTLASAAFTVIANSNTSPVANAGFDQYVAVGEIVTLDASASTDVDGDELSYYWLQIGAPIGSSAVLSDITAVMPNFNIDQQGSYVFQLIVNDGIVDSEADTVIINVGNVAPVANAGADKLVMPGDTVQLDASASTDVDGDILSFQWSIVEAPAGSNATVSDATAIMPTIDIDLDGSYTLQLIVSDAQLESEPDTIVLTSYNIAPVANAGLDRTINVGDSISLDGSGSSDANADLLSYRWSLINVPDGSAAVITDETTATPTVSFDKSGIYIAQLIANDGQLDSQPDTVVLNVANIRPVADAGSDLLLSAGGLLTLDGSGSFDVDNDPLGYQWDFTTIPEGASPLIDNTTSVIVNYNSYIAGLYVGQLTVADGTLTSEPDTAVITVVDDVGPVASNVIAIPNPVDIHTGITLTALLDDSMTGGADIQSAEYRINDGPYMPLIASDGLFNSMTESVEASLSAFGQSAVYEICVRGTDALGNSGADECMLLAIYDPEGGFVTGGGWIDSPAGACQLTAECMTATGKANFGFVSKYKKGATVPTGNTNFVFKAGGIHFKSESYEWLVIAGAKAMYKGVGTINGAGNYGFQINAIDEALIGSTDHDLFRIKIWNIDGGHQVVYDNEIGKDQNGDPSTVIGGGSIVIHKQK